MLSCRTSDDIYQFLLLLSYYIELLFLANKRNILTKSCCLLFRTFYQNLIALWQQEAVFSETNVKYALANNEVKLLGKLAILKLGFLNARTFQF